MKLLFRVPFVASALILPFLLSMALAQGNAAKTDAKADAKAADSADAKTAKPRAKPRGRLPAYYNKVIDGQQREKIYAIQQQYEPKISALKAELQALQDKMNAEVEGVLTPAQLEIVKKAAEEAKEKRKAAGANSEAPDDGDDDSDADTKASDSKPAATSTKSGK